ncbi:MAG: rod shape-determining protein MreC [Bacteroidia bacterium]|nr:rod shape-determining protein MreC [Bacteroidia bacterium]
MWRILQFFTRNGNLLLFIGLEVISFALIVNLNQKQHKIFHGFSMEFSGGLHQIRSSITGYFNLSHENEKLLSQNAKLKTELIRFRDELNTYKFRTPLRSNFSLLPDSLMPEPGFEFIPCQAINNSIRKNYNYITINKGSRNGVMMGMGVISPEGVAGRVIAVSKNYSVALSVLNKRFKLSSRLLSNRNTGTLSWDGGDPYHAILEFIPQTSPLEVNDTVVTSGFTTVFPPGYLIGRVSSFDKETNDGFYNIRVELNTDFGKLENLYVVSQKFRAEIDSLETSSVVE